MKRARVSKLSGTGECPITPLSEVPGVYSFDPAAAGPACLFTPCIAAGGRVIRQGLQECGDEQDLL